MTSVSCHVDTMRMTWYGWDEWLGDQVRSRLCVRHFKAEQQRDDMFARTPDTFFMKIRNQQSSIRDVLRNFDTGHHRSVHARTDR